MTSATRNTKIIYPDLSHKIMELVFEVHNRLGPGFTENIYEEALVCELLANRMNFERQKPIEVIYKGNNLGSYRLDMVIEEKIILELKAVSNLNNLFKAQLSSYLKATGLHLGILINFGSLKVEYARITN